MTDEELERRFNYHAPLTDERRLAHQHIRERCLATAGYIRNVCPEGRERSLAVTKLEEAMFWANAALAREPGQVEV